MRPTGLLSPVVLGVVGACLLAGCGAGHESNSNSNSGSGSGSSGTASSAYCRQLDAAKSDFASLDAKDPDFSKLNDAIARFHTIAAAAPPAVASDWKTLDEAFSTLQKAFADAGISMKDLAAITRGQVPDGMTQTELLSLGSTLQSTVGAMDNAKITAAGNHIEKHAKSVCHVDLTKG